MKLKTKFLSLIAITFLVIIVASYAMFALLREETILGLGGDFAESAVLFNRSRATGPLVREIALATKLAESSVIREWAEDEGNSRKKAAAMRELEDYRRFFADGSWFFALAESGHYYFGDPASEGQTGNVRYTLDPKNVEDNWFYGTLQSGAPYLLNVDYDKKLGVTKVWINVIARNGGKPLGVIGTGLDLSAFLKAAVSADDPGVTSMFINSQGAIQAHKTASEIDYRSISKDPASQKTIFHFMDDESDRMKLREDMKALKTGRPNDVKTMLVSSEGRELLLGLSYIKEIDWYNASFLDTGSMIGKYRFLPFAILLGAALLALSVAIAYILNRQVIRPIARLDGETLKLAGGALEPPLLPPSQDELGRLEASFRLMSEKVMRHTAELQTRVAEDTVEIADKTHRLEEASRELKVLKGLLPTCMYCKKIRDETGRWNSMEEYLTTHSEARFSHGCCPDCEERAYREAGLKR